MTVAFQLKDIEWRMYSKKCIKKLAQLSATFLSSLAVLAFEDTASRDASTIRVTSAAVETKQMIRSRTVADMTCAT